jgi:hypothetical protein
MGDPLSEKIAGSVSPTEVTVPAPAEVATSVPLK